MPDDAMKVAIEVAFKRLQESVVTAAGSAGSTTPLQELIKKTLDDLRRRIDTDPTWLDEVIRAASVDEEPPS